MRVASYLPYGDREDLPTGHAVLHFMILGPLPGQRLWLLDLNTPPAVTVKALNLNQAQEQQDILKYTVDFKYFSFLLVIQCFDDWPEATGSLFRAPAWPLSCRPASSSAPPPWPAVFQSHLHPSRTWSRQTQEGKWFVAAHSLAGGWEERAREIQNEWNNKNSFEI